MVLFGFRGYRMKFMATWGGFGSWYLTPSVRFGLARYDTNGGWLGVTFLQGDLCLTWGKPK